VAAMSLEATPECTPVAPRMVKSEVAKHVDWTPGQWSGEDTEDSQEDEGDREEAESLIATYNEAMASLSEKNKGWQSESVDVSVKKCVGRGNRQGKRNMHRQSHGGMQCYM